VTARHHPDPSPTCNHHSRVITDSIDAFAMVAAKRVPRHRAAAFLFAKYAQRITNCSRKSVESIIECGQLLIAAKDELKHGEFLKMIENNLPFKRSTAQALIKIAAEGRITKYQHAGCLPAHWSTLVKLTQLPDAAFEARIADGTIHQGLKRRRAVEMIESYFSSLPKRGTR
jgi:Protein of unknown function (DUF3102)